MFGESRRTQREAVRVEKSDAFVPLLGITRNDGREWIRLRNARDTVDIGHRYSALLSEEGEAFVTGGFFSQWARESRLRGTKRNLIGEGGDEGAVSRPRRKKRHPVNRGRNGIPLADEELRGKKPAATKG